MSIPRGDCLLLKVLRYGGTDWLGDVKRSRQFLKKSGLFFLVLDNLRGSVRVLCYRSLL